MTTPIKILIADDDPNLLQALKIRLEHQGFEVITTADSYNALAKTVEFQPDLLLLDINMPAGDGFSVQERLKNHDDTGLQNIPVIYITGDASDRLDDLAHELGAAALFHKPINIKSLINTIDAITKPRAA